MSARFALVLCLLLCGPAGADEKYEIPAQYRQAVDLANRLGEALYLHDAAAARASDELVRRGIYRSDKRVRGWLTDRVGDSQSVDVMFLGDEKDLLPLYRVRVPEGDGGPQFEVLDPAMPLEAERRARWKARAVAIDKLNERKDLCSEQYNIVVLPADLLGDKLVRVYMLAATTEPDLMVAGGHFLYTFSANGSLKSQRNFTKACFNVPLTGEKEKGELAAVTLTHLLDPTPTELHVFLNRNYGKAIYLGTTDNSLMWIIDHGWILAARKIDR
jgi:hypothetical protein